MVRDFTVVEYTLVGPHPFIARDVFGKPRKFSCCTERFDGGLYGANIVFREGLRVCSWISENLVPLIERLGNAERVLGGKPKPGVGFSLQAGQVKQRGRRL